MTNEFRREALFHLGRDHQRGENLIYEDRWWEGVMQTKQCPEFDRDFMGRMADQIERAHSRYIDIPIERYRDYHLWALLRNYHEQAPGYLT